MNKRLFGYCLRGIFAFAFSLVLSGWASSADIGKVPLNALDRLPKDAATQLAWLDRVSWGVNARDQANLKRRGLGAWMGTQLRPPTALLPAAAQAQINAMEITRTPLLDLARSFEAQRVAANAMPDEEQKKAAIAAYGQALQRLGRESQQRFLLRALYSPNQLQEQMIWFWMNHFSVDLRKGFYVFVGDYEERAIRPRALGRFRDLLGATLRHPAMLRYLDNEQNAVGRINENYARELMELHTLGVDGGYSQTDVQALARILTGVGLSLRAADAPPPKIREEIQDDYQRVGLMEFNPGRHDYGAKTFLGRPMTKRGMGEVDEALDRLAKAPATARFISRKLAVYFVSDDPSSMLVERMAATFIRDDGDIAATLKTMFESPEFVASLGRKFRDPMHYVVASVRLSYGDRVALTVDPLIGWLSRMGQPMYGHETPDGYPLSEAAWASAGQMNTRFEFARAFGANDAMLFRTDEKVPQETPKFPALGESSAVQMMVRDRLGENTRQILGKAKNLQEWNTLLLASPELMRR